MLSVLERPRQLSPDAPTFARTTSLRMTTHPLPTILVLASLLFGATSCKKEKEDPTVPALVSPANNAAAVNRYPTFTWNASQHTQGYEIQVSTSSTDFSLSVIKDKSTTTATSYRNASLYYANGTYYWRVQAKDGDAASDWSEVRAFVVDANSPG